MLRLPDFKHIACSFKNNILPPLFFPLSCLLLLPSPFSWCCFPRAYARFFNFYSVQYRSTTTPTRTSYRCGQPAQQHGRRFPSKSSETTLCTWSLRVPGLLTEIVQQIHSFRASGVMSSHAASAFELEVRTSCKSAGTVCTTPRAIFLIIYSECCFLLFITPTLPEITTTNPRNCAPGLSSYPPYMNMNIPKAMARMESSNLILLIYTSIPFLFRIGY